VKENADALMSESVQFSVATIVVSMERVKFVRDASVGVDVLAQSKPHIAETAPLPVPARPAGTKIVPPFWVALETRAKFVVFAPAPKKEK